MKKLNVFLDAAHGIDTPGKRSKKLPDGRQVFEWKFSRSVCWDLSRMEGAIAYQPSIPGVDIDYIFPEFEHDRRLRNRTTEINSIAPDLVLSIHANALSRSGKWQTKAHGPRFIVAKKASATSRLAAKCIHDSMAMLTKNAGPIYRERNLYIVSRTRPPAVLIECSFMDNPEDVDLMLDVPGLFAQLIHKGVLDLARSIR